MKLEKEFKVNIESVIEAAFNNHISGLYDRLSQAILSANGDEAEIAAAENRFINGLAHEMDVKERAKRITSTT